MTPEELSKLDAIESKLKSLIETAIKRTPGRWKHSRINGNHIQSVESESHVCQVWGHPDEENDAAFIASCAGPAEAGWRTTLRMIEDNRSRAGLFAIHAKMLRAIIAEWEVML